MIEKQSQFEFGNTNGEHRLAKMASLETVITHQESDEEIAVIPQT